MTIAITIQCKDATATISRTIDKPIITSTIIPVMHQARETINEHSDRYGVVTRAPMEITSPESPSCHDLTPGSVLDVLLAGYHNHTP